jgi:hypothetical protein
MTTKPGDAGTCGFCGTGDGWLGDQGDDSTQYLHSAVRTVDEDGEFHYEPHPGARPDSWAPDNPGQTIIWCGHCVGGLEHKFQRYDDLNLRAEHTALSLWLEMDGPRWSVFHGDEEDQETFRKYRDDLAIHADKLRREQRVADLQNELFRRAGFDLTTRGWRE